MIFLAIVWSVAVFCGPTPGYAGWTQVNGPITLSPTTCADLTHRVQPDDQAFAVFILAHEEGHAHDPLFNRDGYPYCSAAGDCEAAADCYAAGHVYDVARTFGFTGYHARQFRAYVRARRASISYSPIPTWCFT